MQFQSAIFISLSVFTHAGLNRSAGYATKLSLQFSIVIFQPGDEILLVNGFMITESTHAEVVSLIRTRRSLRLKVRSK